MKRREFVRHLEANGCPLKREGASHAIYWNPATGRREPVPRHSEISNLLARKIKVTKPAGTSGIAED